MNKTAWSVALFIALATTSAHARCVVRTDADADGTRRDVVRRLLHAVDGCPTDVSALRRALTEAGYTLLPTMVANRGYHNPGAGSFSFFEMVEGAGAYGAATRDEIFFGHFTDVQNDTLVLAQRPDAGALLVELMAWDDASGVYNFYELRGDGTRGVWFYRGNSADIAQDIASLFVASPPVFGKRLRCSGCHVNGGPIMKELAAPHNDWWRTMRPLPLGRPPDEAVAQLIGTLEDADTLSAAVRAGVAKLARRNALRAWYKAHWQQALRPLFCPHEVNLESDLQPGDVQELPVLLPAAWFVDRFFAQADVSVSRRAYEGALGMLRAGFPETSRADADHAFLTPVRADSDQRMLDAWLAEGAIDTALVHDVLALDMWQPFASARRCAMLATVPPRWSADWQRLWEARLRAFATDGPVAMRTAAAELLANRIDPQRDAGWHRTRAAAFLHACAQRLQSAEAADLVPYLQLLAQRRMEVAASDISKNPLGRILEPGFRVIFPTLTAARDILTLDETCAVRPLDGG